jgi:hypothetical protein
MEFGTLGIMDVEFANRYKGGKSIALDKNGDIVVSGNAGGLIGIARFTRSNIAFSVSGRVLDSNGHPIRQAEIKITDSAGSSQTTYSSSFGFYSFDAVAPGQITLTAKSRRHVFSAVTIALASNLQDLELIAKPNLKQFSNGEEPQATFSR